MSHINYLNIPKELNISKGDIVLLVLDLTVIGITAINAGEKFDANMLIDSFIEKVGKDGTILIATYNWDFCKGKPFDYFKTKGQTGSLGNIALKRNDFKRTKHPIYSFAVYGKHTDYLYGLENISAFGKNSPFEFMVEKNARSIAIGVKFENYFTLAHKAEQDTRVPYRFEKFFQSQYIDCDGTKTTRKYSMHVRHLNLTPSYQFKAFSLFDHFIKNNIAEDIQINDYQCQIIKMGDAYLENKILLEHSLQVDEFRYEEYPEGLPPAEKEMINNCRYLFPINRSLSGEGNRKTLNFIKTKIPSLSIKAEKSCQKVFDWTTPEEWNVSEAFVQDMSGKKIIDFKKNNLHLMGYSTAVNKIMPYKELDEHIYSIKNKPQSIPYVTSYYKKNWGFSIPQILRDELLKNPEKKYKVIIDSSLNPDGVINYADTIISGYSDREIILSTNICHPSMANNELSGIVVAIEAAKYIKSLQSRKYNYRIVFIPETIGSLIYLNKHLEHLKDKLDAGFVLSCIGDDGDYSCIHSPYGNNLADKVANHMLKYITNKPKIYSFLERGSDERQYCSPLANLPFCTLTRTKFGEFPQYHLSDDNLDFISEKGLAGGLEMIKRCINLLEINETYRSTVIGEPQLGKRNLYPNTSIKTANYNRVLMNFLAYADGKNDLIDIAETIGVNAMSLANIVDELLNCGLIEISPKISND